MERIRIIHGDITCMEVDAIVNAANNRLAGGGGVDGAIHRAGGPAIAIECIQIREEFEGCDTGEAVVTRGGDLPCNHVIHTVGPVWHGGDEGEEELLRRCYRNSLKKAVEIGAKSIAFPNISTGVYGYPVRAAARVALEEVMAFGERKKGITVYLVSYLEEDYHIYMELLGE